MKVAVCSDLHLEFGDLNITNDENIDVLILSGDICVAKDIDRPEKGSRVVDFFKRCSFQFPNVVYVMGNHEHYHGDFATSPVIIQKMIAENHLNNVHFLDKESVVINDVIPAYCKGKVFTYVKKNIGIKMPSGLEKLSFQRKLKVRNS